MVICCSKIESLLTWLRCEHNTVPPCKDKILPSRHIRGKAVYITRQTNLGSDIKNYSAEDHQYDIKQVDPIIFTSILNCVLVFPFPSTGACVDIYQCLRMIVK